MQQTTSLFDAPINLIIFDCDGVLIDSETLSRQTLLLQLITLGVEVSNEYFETHFLGRSYEHVSTKILDDFGVMLPEQFREDYQQALIETFKAELQPTLELEQMLQQLNVLYCVATSSSPTRVAHALTVAGLMHFFEGRIFTCSEVKKGKPAPDIFLHAAAKMGFAAKDCLVIEDSAAGIQGALAANMRVVKYAGASHLIDSEASGSDILRGVCTIKHWNRLFEVCATLKSDI
jgi:HAD superfamily hydrolase (TIGR01509 family)